MPDEQTTNGKAAHARGAVGQLRYRFEIHPEQLSPDFLQTYTDRLERALSSIWDLPVKPSRPISPQSIAGWHRRLLWGLEPAGRFGRFRQYMERSSYEIWDEDETQGDREPKHCVCPGIEVTPDEPRAIFDAVEDACNSFQRAVDAPEQVGTDKAKIISAVRPCAELYAEILRTRPFMTANDPVAYLTLQAGYLRMGLNPLLYSPRPPTSSDDVQRAAINLSFNRALARSLRPNADDVDELVNFLATHASFR